MTRIVVRIDHLLLRGVPHASRRAVAEALTGALTASWSEPGAAQRVASIGDVRRMRLGRIPVAPTAAGGDLGAAVGRRIAGAVER
jgi:hypothetical protein